jgi:hypothetical protein
MSLPSWVTPGKGLVTFWEILRMIANDGYACFGASEMFSVLQLKVRDGVAMTPKLEAAYLRGLTDLRNHFTRMGLSTSIRYFDDMIRAWQKGGFDSASTHLLETRKALRYELESFAFKPLLAGEADLYRSAAPFGQAVSDAFPAATYDIGESAKCLALGRYTACVFHAERSLEVGVIALGHAVGVRKHKPTWEAVLGAIDRKLSPPAKGAKTPKKKPRWRRNEEFYAEAAMHLRATKVAIRNPTMHREKAYGPDKAREVYEGSKAFYSHLATKLRQRGGQP